LKDVNALIPSEEGNEWLSDACVWGSIIAAGPYPLPPDTVIEDPVILGASRVTMKPYEIATSIKRSILPLIVGKDETRHWVTVVIDFKYDKSAEEMHAVAGVLNSLSGYRREIRKGISEYLAGAFGLWLGRQEVKDIEIGRQPNGSDCGTITIANCISALRGKPYHETWTLDQCNRKRVLYLMKIYDNARHKKTGRKELPDEEGGLMNASRTDSSQNEDGHSSEQATGPDNLKESEGPDTGSLRELALTALKLTDEDKKKYRNDRYKPPQPVINVQDRMCRIMVPEYFDIFHLGQGDLLNSCLDNIDRSNDIIETLTMAAGFQEEEKGWFTISRQAIKRLEPVAGYARENPEGDDLRTLQLAMIRFCTRLRLSFMLFSALGIKLPPLRTSSTTDPRRQARISPAQNIKTGNGPDETSRSNLETGSQGISNGTQEIPRSVSISNGLPTIKYIPHQFEVAVRDIDRKKPESNVLINKYCCDVISHHFVILRNELDYGLNPDLPCYDTVTTTMQRAACNQWRVASGVKFSETGNIWKLDRENWGRTIFVIGVTSLPWPEEKLIGNEKNEDSRIRNKNNVITHLRLLVLGQEVPVLWYPISQIWKWGIRSIREDMSAYREAIGQYEPGSPRDWITQQRKKLACSSVEDYETKDWRTRTRFSRQQPPQSQSQQPAGSQAQQQFQPSGFQTQQPSTSQTQQSAGFQTSQSPKPSGLQTTEAQPQQPVTPGVFVSQAEWEAMLKDREHLENLKALARNDRPEGHLPTPNVSRETSPQQ
jgi:hypothetical protein